MKPRIGIIGTGATVGIAHYHTLGLLADGRTEIAAVYDTNPLGAQKFLREHGLSNALVCDSYTQLLECVDAVDICTPNYTHIDYVLGAIAAGKAIFVEKPLALSASDSRRAVDALQGKDLFNMVGFVYRYAHMMPVLRSLVRYEIGRVYTFSASYGGKRLADPRIGVEWRMQRNLSGSGALGDFGSHLIDLAAYTAGLYFDKVSGLSSTVIPVRPADPQGKTLVENDDQAVFTARTTGNALAAFTTSRVGMDELRLLVVGEGGLARVNLAAPETVIFQPAKDGVYTGETRQIPVEPQEYFNGWFAAQMQAFAGGLLGEECEVADIRQGHYVECVLEAAERAAATNAIRVEV